MRFLLAVGLAAALATSAGAQWLEAQFGIPDSLSDISGSNVILFRSDNHHAYVSGIEAEYLQILDYTTRTKVKRVEAGGWASDMFYCPDRQRLYVVCTDRGGITVLDGNDSVLGEVELPTDPIVGVYNPLEHKAYIGTGDGGGVVIMDPGPDTVLAAVEVEDNLVRAVFDSAANRVFFLGEYGADSSLYALDCGADTLRARMPTPDDYCLDLAWNPATRRLYCLGNSATNQRPEVWVYDADSLAVVATIALPEAWYNMEGALLLNPDAGYLCAFWGYPSHRQGSDWPEDSMAVIDCSSNTIHGFIELPDAAVLAGMCLNPQDNKVYAASSELDKVAVIRLPDTVAGWIDTGSGPSCVAWNPDNDEVVIPEDHDFLSFVSGASDSIVARMDYRAFYVYTLTWVPAGDKLYATGRDGLAVIGQDNRVRKIVSEVLRGPGAGTAYSAELNRLYHPDGWGNRLVVFDCAADSVVGSESLPFSPSWPSFLVPGSHKLYLPSFVGDVAVYDVYQDTVVGVKPGLGTRFCYSPRTGMVYGALRNDVLNVVDPTRDTAVKAICPCPNQCLAVNTTDNEIYTADVPSQSRNVYVTDLETLTRPDSFSVPGHPTCLAWYEPLNKLYAITDSWIVAIDCRTRSVTKTIPLLGPGGHPDAVFSYRNDRLWVGRWHGVWVVQCRIDSLVAYFSEVAHVDANMAWNAIDNRIYTCRDNIVSVFRDDLIGTGEENLVRAEGGFRLLANPVAGSARFALPRNGGGTLVVWDIAGRLVWQTDIVARQTEVTWPGKDLHGARVPAGVYFVALETGTTTTTAKVVLR